MQPRVEFRGRLSRSDRRPANPGRYALLFQLYPSDRSQRVLWSEAHSKVEVRAGGFYDVVLGDQAPLGPELFADSPRWLAVQVLRQGSPTGEHAPRVPLLGDTLRLDARLDAVVGRVQHLEGALVGAVEPDEDEDAERQRRLRALPQRIQQLFDALQALAGRVGGLEDAAPIDALRQTQARLDERIAAAEQKLARAEDELEELVGPDGDVVDLLDRVEVLEIGGGSGGRPARGAEAELATLKAAVDQLRRRQEKLEDTIGRLIGRMGSAGVVTATFPSEQPPLEGAVVSVVGGQAVTARSGRGAVVGVSLGSRDGKVTVAVGGVVRCRVFGAVQAGELLVPSNVPGHAQAGTDGPIIGRALAEQADGRGKMKVRLL